ncbi:MAG TPA: arylsulfatase [Bacteroidales bacterium]|nr:arylsulfatase [Bacteroidales bacterium]
MKGLKTGLNTWAGRAPVIISVMAAIFLLNTLVVEGQRNQVKRPNIIVILSDDIGYSDIGCFGSEIETPNLDRLATDGVRFTHFYNAARCSPSRAALFTGLYPHQAGMGHLASSIPYEEPGYRDDLSRNTMTLAEVLKQAGYSAYMTGKWHLARDLSPTGDKSNWPLQRGFDRFFGTINGSGSYFDPGTLTCNNDFVAPGKDFYYTDAISDTTVKYISQHPKDKPFFLYVAYTAAHWPLHAPEKEIEKYKGMYDIGWDSLRALRFNKLKKLGIIDDNCKLTARGVAVPAWENEPMKEWQARRMEVYAAMIDVMDQGIGRIISALEQKGELENTVIFYMQDNGGCAEPQGTNKPTVPLIADQKILKPFPYDQVLTVRRPEYTRDGRYVRSGRGVMAGDADTWVAYGEEWANVSNTPFREYKQWVHEGGIASPLIVFWPAGISRTGVLNREVSHLIDIMPTCLEIARAPYPEKYNNNKILPFEGRSLIPALKNRHINREFLFWEHSANRAIRNGKWKLVAKVKKQMEFSSSDENAWELYNLNTDPSETNNLANKYPKRVKKMAERWEKEAFRTQTKPWPWNKD